MTETIEIKSTKRLTRAEKDIWARVVSTRNRAGNPISEAEIEVLLDYVRGRTRLAELRKALADADPRASAGWRLTLIRQIESSESASLRRARALRLVPE